MALDPVEFDTYTSGPPEPEPQVAGEAAGKPAGLRKWIAYLWIPLATVVLVQISVCTSQNQQLESTRNQVSGLRQEVSGLQNENQQLKEQVKAHTQRPTRTIEFTEVLVGKSTDSLEDTSTGVHLGQSGLETIQFAARGPSTLADATAYGNISIALVQPGGESMCAGELAIQNDDNNQWAVGGSCSGQGEFVAGEWQIHLSYRGHTFSRTFYVDAPSPQ